MKKIWLAVAMTLALTACSEEDNASEQTENIVTPVEVAAVAEDDLIVEKRFYGTLMPETTIPVIPPAAGEVSSVEVAKGDEVTEDELLATLKTADGRGTIDIEAPGAGQITMLAAEEGGFVSGSEPLATIVDLSAVTAQLAVPAEELELFETNEEAEVVVDTADYEKTVAIDYVAAVPDDTGLYPVELTLDNEAGNLKPGMVAVVRLPQKTVADTLLIPTAALVEENEQAFVYVVQEKQVVKTPITVTEVQSDVTAVDSEQLQAGAMVVTKGQLTLTDGGEISIVKEEQAQ